MQLKKNIMIISRIESFILNKGIADAYKRSDRLFRSWSQMV